jgi:hypothetical protein
MTPDAMRRIQTDAGPAKGAGGVDQVLRNDLVLDDLLLMIDVVDKEIEGMNPLL